MLMHMVTIATYRTSGGREFVVTVFSLAPWVILIENLENMVTERCVLELPLHDALFANIFLRGSDHSLDGHPLDLVVVWRVLCDLWRVRLACMAILPCVSACRVETGLFIGRFLSNMLVATFIDAEVLLERNEKTCCSPIGGCLTLALFRILSLIAIIAWLFSAFGFFDLFHFSCKVCFYIVA